MMARMVVLWTASCARGVASMIPRPPAAVLPRAAERNLSGQCFNEYHSYAKCCYCSKQGGGELKCWTGWQDTFNYESCCVFPYGVLERDLSRRQSESAMLVPFIPCAERAGVRLDKVRYHLPSIDLVVQQVRLNDHLRNSWIVAWQGGYLMAELLLTGWIPFRSPTARPLHVLELGACLGLPSLAAAAMGHNVLATDSDAQAVRNLRYNADQLGFRNLQGYVLNVSGVGPSPTLQGPFDVVMVAGPLGNFIGLREVCAIRALCSQGTRVLMTLFWEDSPFPYMATYRRYVLEHFETVDTLEPASVEQNLLLPAGFKYGAMELLPKPLSPDKACWSA